MKTSGRQIIWTDNLECYKASFWSLLINHLKKSEMCQGVQCKMKENKLPEPLTWDNMTDCHYSF